MSLFPKKVEYPFKVNHKYVLIIKVKHIETKFDPVRASPQTHDLSTGI